MSPYGVRLRIERSITTNRAVERGHSYPQPVLTKDSHVKIVKMPLFQHYHLDDCSVYYRRQVRVPHDKFTSKGVATSFLM